MEFLPYRDAMMGRPWTVNCQVNPISSLTVTGIPLAGPYRSGMMDYRESEGHKDWLKQQDAAFNSPSGLNSHREMNFGESVTTPISFLPDAIKSVEVYPTNSVFERERRGNEAFMRQMREESARENERIMEGVRYLREKEKEKKLIDLDRIMKQNEEYFARTIVKPSWSPTTDHSFDNSLFVNQDKKGKHFGNGFGIQPINVDNDVLPSGGMHDSFNVNSSGDIFGGHTTIELKDGLKRRLGW